MPTDLPSYVRSQRLEIRQWTEADAPALNAAIADSLEHLRPWMSWAADGVPSLEDQRDRIRRWRDIWERGGDSVLGIFKDGTVVGSTGLHRRMGPPALEIGYWIHVDHTRKGYATEVGEALTTAAFEVPGIDRVEIHHDKGNTASSGIPRRLGFTLVAEIPEQKQAPAELGIECRWITTKADWTARHDTRSSDHPRN